jgi:predicted Zn-ribbon and HTH transcriptional regulator
MIPLIVELKGCRDKRTYKTLKDAKKQAKKDTEKYGKQMRPYECKVCLYFHLTSKPQ